MKKLFFILALSISLICCNEKSDGNANTLAEDKISFKKEGDLKIYKTDSSTVDLEIEIAETGYETATGLMYRNEMKEDRGMLFIFDNKSVHSFYMKNTEFPLDIVYIDANQKIASIVENAKPFDEEGLSSEIPVQYVLEVNGGMTEKWNVNPGDSISWKVD